MKRGGPLLKTGTGNEFQRPPWPEPDRTSRLAPFFKGFISISINESANYGLSSKTRNKNTLCLKIQYDFNCGLFLQLKYSKKVDTVFMFRMSCRKRDNRQKLRGFRCNRAGQNYNKRGLLFRAAPQEVASGILDSAGSWQLVSASSVQHLNTQASALQAFNS